MRIIEKLVSLIAPHDCLDCGTEGTLVCAWCMPNAFLPLPDRCYRCNKLSRDSKVCTRCRRSSPLHAVWVCTEYEGLAKRLVHKLKFERAGAAALPIAEAMAETLPYFTKKTVVTHIPTATSRYRQRGYDQAELIARRFAQLKGLQYIPLLTRQGHSRQVGAKRLLRLSQLEGAFRPRNAYAAAGAEVILIDDIVTTGATIDAAARVLKAAGAKRVSAAIFGQKI